MVAIVEFVEEKSKDVVAGDLIKIEDVVCLVVNRQGWKHPYRSLMNKAEKSKSNLAIVVLEGVLTGPALATDFQRYFENGNFEIFKKANNWKIVAGDWHKEEYQGLRKNEKTNNNH